MRLRWHFMPTTPTSGGFVLEGVKRHSAIQNGQVSDRWIWAPLR